MDSILIVGTGALACLFAARLAAQGTVGELKEVFAGRAVLEVNAPDLGKALEIAMTGRKGVLDQLSGEGVDTLRGRD